MGLILAVRKLSKNEVATTASLDRMEARFNATMEKLDATDHELAEKVEELVKGFAGIGDTVRAVVDRTMT